MRRSRIRVSVVMTLGLLALAAPAARGDIFAVADHDTTGSPSNIDIVVADTSGLAASLPAGVNTQADESHPSVSADGTRLVFERQPDPNTTRIIVVNLTNGQQADVINGFDAAQIGPATPSITPDGTGVLVGSSKSTGPVLIDVSAFPSGPYPHTDIAGANEPLDPIATGSARGSLFAFVTEGASGIAYGRVGGSAIKQTPPSGQLNLSPALASPNGTPTVMFMSANFFGNADIQFCAPLSPTGACQLAPLPGTVNTGADETRPAFTSDGRYVGFLRNSGSHQRVFVWDSETQTLLDNSGTDLGPSAPIQSGNLSLYEKPVFHFTSLSPRGQVSFNLLSASLVGIIVQRVTGHQKLFGRTVPKLGPARRVPLGSFHRGRGKAHWNLRIAGKRLRPGTYQVTPRALTSKGKVRDLGKPRLLRIRHR